VWRVSRRFLSQDKAAAFHLIGKNEKRISLAPLGVYH
jgi:hypothetical protein